MPQKIIAGFLVIAIVLAILGALMMVIKASRELWRERVIAITGGTRIRQRAQITD